MQNNRFLFWAVTGCLSIAVAIFARTMLMEDLQPNREEPFQVSLIVSSDDPYWDSVIAGAKDSAKNHNVELDVIVPKSSEEQTDLLKKVDSQSTEGVAVSPALPSEQIELLNGLAKKTKLVTIDNDAQGSLRHCYVGTDNYSAGRTAARLVKEVIPEGGEIVLFAGDTKRENGKLRRQGFFDELSGHSRPPGDVVDPLDEELVVGSYRVAKTYVDDLDREKALSNVQLALEENPNVSLVLGFYSYHGPKCLEVLAEKEKLGEVKIIAFDDQEETLQGVLAGDVSATIVQDSYHYGYESVRLLSEIIGGATYAAPIAGGGSLNLPCTVLRQDDVESYKAQLESRSNSMKK